ncbi:MAG: hypothetical protein HYR67_15150 [Bacteroidetes bacterium]|nr:hypothetical protein [Bacteroidota bacterium]
MNTSSTSGFVQSGGLTKAIFMAGLLAGTLDIIAACIQAYLVKSITPDRILLYIATSLFGRDAYAGGISMILVGLLIHYLIATGWTTLFFLSYPKINFLTQNKIVVGLLYGVFVWVMMNRVLVPLTRVATGPFKLSNALIGCAILMMCIGLPISIMAHRYYSDKH